jgi:flagellar biogenesis protein FliO
MKNDLGGPMKGIDETKFTFAKMLLIIAFIVFFLILVYAVIMAHLKLENNLAVITSWSITLFSLSTQYLKEKK